VRARAAWAAIILSVAPLGGLASVDAVQFHFVDRVLPNRGKTGDLIVGTIDCAVDACVSKFPACGQAVVGASHDVWLNQAGLILFRRGLYLSRSGADSHFDLEWVIRESRMSETSHPKHGTAAENHLLMFVDCLRNRRTKIYEIAEIDCWRSADIYQRQFYLEQTPFDGIEFESANYLNSKINPRATAYYKQSVRNVRRPRSCLGGIFGGLDRCLHVAGLGGGTISGQFQLALASVPQSIGRPFQGKSEGSNRESGERRKYPAYAVKNLRDFNSKELNNLIAGAVFFLGLFGYFAYFVVTRNERKKQDDQNRPGAEPK
jgi:hypothetical protein